ncbi:MAG TPA: response regulator [Candidatus Aminicenantes bacterium]|nr:response regulator [Candidatus Aminicenantes bacterium]
MTHENDLTASVKKKKVLIVERETEIRDLLRITLECGGIENLIILSRGQAAMRTALRERPDLILTGVDLSDEMDGFDLTREIKLRKDFRGIVLILSANTQKRDIENGLAAGADAYLTKPFSPNELLETVLSMLKRPHTNAMFPAISMHRGETIHEQPNISV